ncbi:MAG: hypothetical protein QNJ78_11200 [Gammaproteobacteria bacterium]|nr:hypothetical protein [Gammaproteobacteria bacterium]
MLSLVLLMMLVNASATAVESDESLVLRLEAATHYTERYALISTLTNRLTTDPLSVEHTDRIVRVIMSNERYIGDRVARILQTLAGERGLSEQSRILIAKWLVRDRAIHFTHQPLIAELLTVSSTPMPEEAFTTLERAVQGSISKNSRAILEALALTPPDNSRFERALEAIRVALFSGKYSNMRRDAAMMLARLGQSRPLPSTVIDSLVHVATNDKYMTTRMEALVTLVSQPLAMDLATTLSKSLAAEIITPTPELRERSGFLGSRATEVLGKLHEPPYPDHVVFAWIALTGGQYIDLPLAKLAAVIERGELTPEQYARLNQVAERHHWPDKRQAIYAVLYGQQSAAVLPDVLREFESSGDEKARIRAGYRLLNQFAERGVPREIANIAARVLETGAGSETLVVAAMLLANTREDHRTREEQLSAALERHPYEYGLYTPLVDLVTRDRIDGAVIRYAADNSLAKEFRRHLLRHFAEASGSQTALSAAAEASLKKAARDADDYYVIQHAGEALEAWGANVPLRVFLTKRKHQTTALYVLLITITLTNLGAGFATFISLAGMPLQSRHSGLKRTGLIVGWLLLSAGMVVLLLVGLLGFFGHNRPPKPNETLIFNIPAYLGTVVYLGLAWLAWRRYRHTSSRISSATSSSLSRHQDRSGFKLNE